MSPAVASDGKLQKGVPRASGDEPTNKRWGNTDGSCSPCERG